MGAELDCVDGGVGGLREIVRRREREMESAEIWGAVER